MIYTVFEPYIIYDLFDFPIIKHFGFHLYFNNADLAIAIVILLGIFIFWFSLNRKHLMLYVIPHAWQSFMEHMFFIAESIVEQNIFSLEDARLAFPLSFCLFFFIAFLNSIGLVPYIFTVTSSFVITLFISFSLFIGANIRGINLHGKHFIRIFYPEGTSFEMALLLLPIEMVSFMAKPLSLGLRLFANMAAGHILLKSLGGFTSLLGQSMGHSFFFTLINMPLFFIFVLLFLELAIAVIQAFVFATLVCMSINNAVELE